MSGRRTHRIVFANEKGGTGKSTTAVHVAVALAYQGARVVAIDLDHRQRTMDRYFENRDETARRRKISQFSITEMAILFWRMPMAGDWHMRRRTATCRRTPSPHACWPPPS